MRVMEVLSGGKTPEGKSKAADHSSSDVHTDFEKNVTKQRGEVRRLKAQKPIKPIKLV